jgi:hypothetical protein
MSELAREIYAILRGLIPDSRARITYQELVEELGPLPPPNGGLHWRDPRLDEALGELVTACRAVGLPAISAIVVRAQEDSPGPGYYPLAHPDEWDAGELQALIAWGHEREQVRQTTFPPALGG